jgi:hypothetical protein
MKKLIFTLLTTLPLIANFNFGECSGSGTFEQQIIHYNGDYENAIFVGSIPVGIEGLHIELISDNDVDIRLYGENEDKIVHWPYGLLSKSYSEIKTYQDINVSYSGYNGINGLKGHEFIEVEGATPTVMTMKAFGYQSGYATVNYSWTGKIGCTAKVSGEGNFTQNIETNMTTLVGTIPPNVNNVHINLTSNNDIDIQLYGEDGTAIVSWKPKGLLSQDSMQSIIYHDMNITWSGYLGVDGKAGNEYIKITPQTTELLIMKVFGYQAGTADVRYTWGNNDTNITDTVVPVISLIGKSEINITVGEVYEDAGATASDNVDGDITANVVINNPVDTTIVGMYIITYDVNDTAGNVAIQVKRIVHVIEVSNTLYGPELIYGGGNELGGLDSSIWDTHGDTYDPQLREYNGHEFLYSSNKGDAGAGMHQCFSTEIDREYNVKAILIGTDTNREEDWNGESYITISKDSAEVDKSNVIAESEHIAGGVETEVSFNFEAVSPVSCLAIRSSGAWEYANARAISVKALNSDPIEDKTPPVITLNGDAVVEVVEGNSYKDAGAVATDNVDGDITDKIVVVNTVDSSTIGDYNVTYSAKDSAGNEAKEIRVVKVVGQNQKPDNDVIVPLDRRSEWNKAGVSGGIPDTSSWVNIDVSDWGIEPNGENITSTLQSKIDNLDISNSYIINFDSGTYRLDGTLKIRRDNIILRGIGINTKLDCYKPNSWEGCISVLSPGEYGLDGNSKVQDLPNDAGYTKGSTSLKVADASKFKVGSFVEIFQTNNPDEITKNTDGYSYAFQHLLGQILEIESISDNTLYFKTKIRHTYLAEYEPKILPREFIKNIGIENLHIEIKEVTDGTAPFTIYLHRTSNTWVRNIVSEMTNNAHVSITGSVHCEVRDSVFTESHDYGDGGRGYGALTDYHSTDNLVINNYFYKLRHAMIFSQGANGNVFGYNYSDFEYQEYNGDYLTWGPDISNHGMYAYMNLVEGNRANMLGIADTSYHGSSGPDNIYFRNKLVGNDEYYDIGELKAHCYDRYLFIDISHYQYLLNNYLITDKKYTSDISYYENNIEHGNSLRGADVTWDSSISTQEFPDSYFLNSKPDFFGDKRWPLYGIEDSIGFDDTLPAEDLKKELIEINANEVTIVGFDEKYTTIQDAIDNAPSGATVIVGSGIYSPVNIDKNINLVGADGPMIRGDKEVATWQYDETKKLYYASSPCTIPAKEGESVGGIEMLFMNGEEQKAARYPNSGYLKVEDSPDNSTFSLEEFDGDSLDIKDAVAHIRMSNWRVASRRVASFSDGYINLTEEAKSNSSLITSDFMVFFTQVLGAIDANNEWAWNNGKIYMKSSDEPKNVTVACSEYGIYLDENAKRVTIEGLNISRISGHGITKKFDTRKSADDDLVIRDNNISYVTKRGIYLRDFYKQDERLPADTLIEGNEVSYAREGGIWLFADNALVQNNYMHDIGGSELDDDVLAYGSSGNMLTGITVTVSSGTKILNNRLDKIGYNGIAIDNGWAGWKSNEGRVIANNYITNAMLTLNDGGCIYTYTNKIDFINDGTAESRERDVIRDNIIQNCIGSSASVVPDPWKGLGERAGEGIYLDDLSSYTDVYNNTVIGATKNLFLHNSFKVNAHDNSLITPFNISIYLSQGGADGADREDVYINNNTIDSRSKLTYKLIYNDGQEFLTGANNNIVRVDSGETLGVREGYGTEPNISLSQWHDMGYDIDTTVIEDSTEPVVLINPSFNDVLFSNLEGCRKFDNAPLDTTSQIVVPYASLVLFGCEYYIAGTYSESE